MINPVSGGSATEAKIRIHLDELRRQFEAYRTLDRVTGGIATVAESILALEKVLKDDPMAHSDAEYDFLRKNQTVHWNTGVPTWDHYTLVDGEWVITRYEINVELTNPRVRTEHHENF